MVDSGSNDIYSRYTTKTITDIRSYSKHLDEKAFTDYVIKYFITDVESYSLKLSSKNY